MIVGRDRKICIALRTNQIAGFIAVFVLETKLEGFDWFSENWLLYFSLWSRTRKIEIIKL